MKISQYIVPILIISLLLMVHYVEQTERLQEDFPSIETGKYYTYEVTKHFNNGTIKHYELSIRIDNVTIERDNFSVRFYIVENNHEEVFIGTYNYGVPMIKAGPIYFFNTREYDEILSDYDSNQLSFYWFGTTPIRALILKNSSAELIVDEALGVVLEAEFVLGSLTTQYKLVKTNALSPHLGAITFLGVIIGAIIMIMVFKELRKHKEAL